MRIAIALAGLACLVVIIVYADPASAQTGPTNYRAAFGALTAADQDISQQPAQSFSTGGGYSCQNGQYGTVSVTAGSTYFVVTAQSSGNITVTGSSSGAYYHNTGSSGFFARQAGVTLLWSETSGSGQTVMASIVPTVSETITVTCGNNGYGSYNGNLPGVGLVGYFTSTPHCTTCRVGAVYQSVTIQGEAAILSTQTSKHPPNEKLTWTRINSHRLVELAGVGSGGNVAEIAQGFPAPAGGAYLDTTRIGMFGSGTFTCSGTLRISVTNTLSVPWNELAEAAGVQVPWTLSGTAPTSSFVTVNWAAATITEDAGSVSFGSPTWSIGGTTVTGENLKHLAPALSTSQGEYYARAFWSQGNCGSSAYVMSRYSGSDSYSGGTAWTVSGGVWTQVANQDLGGLILSTFGGNRTFEWRLNATARQAGGATYVYIAEHERDSVLGLVTPVSSWGGVALYGKDLYELAGGAGTAECSFGGLTNSACSVKEYRLGHIPIPYNETADAFTVTINTNGMGRNLLYAGVLTGQPPQTHLTQVTWDYQSSTGNDLTVYQLWSTDDYFAFADFTVKECANADCTEFGATLSNVSYSAKICGGIRSAAGTPDAAGKFNISGQDLPGCDIIITLTGSGYAETAWSVQITSSGTHTYTIGIFKAGTTSGNAQLAATSVVFTGNTTRYIPDRVAINITRGRNADVFVGLDKVDATSGLVQHNIIRATYWKAFDSNTFQFYYPNKAKSTSQEIGLYVLWVMNDTGVVLNHTKFFILPAGGNAADYDVTITADFLRGIQEKGYISAQQTFQSQYQASILAVQKSVRDQVYENFQKVSEYGWFVIGFLLFLATVRAFRR